MTDSTKEKHSDCELCDLAQKLGHENCSVLANEMITDLLDCIFKKSDNFAALAKSKLDTGEILPDEYAKLLKQKNYAMGYAAATIAAFMSFDGPKLPPDTIIDMVSRRINEILINLVGGGVGIPIPASGVPEIIQTLKTLGIKVDVVGGVGGVDDIGTVNISKKDKETDPSLN